MSGVVQQKQLRQNESSCFLSPFLFTCLQNNLNFHCNSPWHFLIYFPFSLVGLMRKYGCRILNQLYGQCIWCILTDRLSPYEDLGLEDFFTRNIRTCSSWPGICSRKTFASERFLFTWKEAGGVIIAKQCKRTKEKRKVYFLSFLWISGWLVDLFTFSIKYMKSFLLRGIPGGTGPCPSTCNFFRFASIARCQDQESGFVASVPRDWLAWSMCSTGWDSDLSCSSQVFPWYR